MVLENLIPRKVWDIFENLFTKTYRASKHEDAIRRKIKDWVEEKKLNRGIYLEIFEDIVGNLLIKIPATKGLEKSKTLILQGHMDMVVESDRKDDFDFEKDPIDLKIEDGGKWVTADGTTLGADNGIGVSMMLAIIAEIADSEIEHGPLELLITVDEETGLTGAFNMDIASLHIEGNHLINMDSEELGSIVIGSAGGGGVVFEKYIDLIEYSDLYEIAGEFNCFILSVSGLLGGHSGVDIHLDRANAHKIVSRILNTSIDSIQNTLNTTQNGNDNEFFFNIVEWNGGSKTNAIPRESTIKFFILKKLAAKFLETFEREKEIVLSHFLTKNSRGKILEPNISVEIRKIKIMPKRAIYQADSLAILSLLYMIPNGVIAYSNTMEGLVETSNNLAILSTDFENRIFKIQTSARSNINVELERFRTKLMNLGDLVRWKTTLTPSYPGWEPKPNSPFLRFIKDKYKKILKTEISTKAIHAGLETGIIGAKIPGIEMVSIGPTIINPHSPGEKVEVESVNLFYKVLKEIINSFAQFEQD